MSLAKSLLVASFFVLGAPIMGCAADSSAPVEAGEEADVVSSSDAKLKKELGELIAGLETGGGEGDPDPYKVIDYRPKSGEKLDDATLYKRLLPKMLPGRTGEGEAFPGMQERPIADEWKDLTADEDPARAKKWKEVKKFFDANLKGSRALVLGWASSEGGSIETGEVAQVIVGVTASGRIIAIWGVDVWT